MHPHWLWNIFFIVVFSLGQLLFMLKRADLARRSPLNGVKTIGNFFALNWVVLLFRAVIEWLVFLWPYRSASNDVLQSVVHKVWAGFPFQLPQHRGLAGCFALGMGADVLLDWMFGASWFSAIPVLRRLKENIPQSPRVQQMITEVWQAKSQTPGPEA